MTPQGRVLVAGGIAAALLLAGCGSNTAPLVEGEDSGVADLDRDDLSAGESEPVIDSMYPDIGYANIDVLHYSLALDYQPESKVISGTATLTIRPVEDSPEFGLDLSDAMAVTEVTVDGQSTQFGQTELDLTVQAALSAQQQTVVEITYSGTPELVPAPAQRGDMSEGLGASVDPRTGALWAFQEPYGALTWYPVNDHPSDEALYDFAITVPEGYAGVASGTFVGQEGNTYSWSSSDPVASYLTTIAVDRYELTEMEGPHGIPITVWIPPQYADFAPILQQMPEMLQWLEEHYGPYPFKSAGVVLVGGESAMETQEMVTFSGGMLNWPGVDDGYVAGVVVHELAHQWFGDAVTPLDWTGLWLNEGAATYAEQMWNVDAGYVAEEDVVESWREEDGYLRMAYGPPGKPDPSAFASSNSYVCPALMLVALRDELGGREGVDEFLAAWVVAHDNQSVTREDFIAFLNEHSGKDLTALVNEWLDSTTTPK